VLFDIVLDWELDILSTKEWMSGEGMWGVFVFVFECFRAWRLELHLREKDVGMAISDSENPLMYRRPGQIISIPATISQYW